MPKAIKDKPTARKDDKRVIKNGPKASADEADALIWTVSIFSSPYLVYRMDQTGAKAVRKNFSLPTPWHVSLLFASHHKVSPER
jgi:hypothetical protein